MQVASKPSSGHQKLVAKEEEVIKDLSQLYCASRSEKNRKTIFWLPAVDEIIAANESVLVSGAPSVARNADYYRAFNEASRPGTPDNVR